MSSVNALLRKLCAPIESRDVNLRINPRYTTVLLSDPRYHGVDTEDLISLASGKMKGVTDRCTAIAVLKGVNHG